MDPLFLKYRPQKFEDLVGQESVVRTLKNAAIQNASSHAYLFCGSRGTGKTSIARIFSRALNCLQGVDGDPCGICDICKKAQQNSLIDIVEIDAASNRGIDEIRDLRDKIKFLPTQLKKKIYIIDEVHMLTIPAFNALLKTLEEPPDYAYFLLATTEKHKLPETIISRCMVFDFKRFAPDQIIHRLEYIAQQESIVIDEESLKLIAQQSSGGMRDAISMLDQLAAEYDKSITFEKTTQSLGLSSDTTFELLWETIAKKNQKEALEIIHTERSRGVDFRFFGNQWLVFLQKKLHEAVDNNDKASLDAIMPMIECVQNAIQNLKSSPIAHLPFEIAVLKIISNSLASIPPMVLKTPPEKKPQPDPPKTPAPKLTELSAIPPSTKSTAPIASSSNSSILPETVKTEPQEAIEEKLNMSSMSFQDTSAENISRKILEDFEMKPSQKSSFKRAAFSLQNNNLIICFDSQFDMEHVCTSEWKVKIKNYIETKFPSLEVVYEAKKHEESKKVTSEVIEDIFGA